MLKYLCLVPNEDCVIERDIYIEVTSEIKSSDMTSAISVHGAADTIQNSMRPFLGSGKSNIAFIMFHFIFKLFLMDRSLLSFGLFVSGDNLDQGFPT